MDVMEALKSMLETFLADDSYECLNPKTGYKVALFTDHFDIVDKRRPIYYRPTVPILQVSDAQEMRKSLQKWFDEPLNGLVSK